MTIALGVIALPSPNVDNGMLTPERDTSYGNPNLYICYTGKGGIRQHDESWGNLEDMVDEGDRWPFNYPNSGVVGLRSEHGICYHNK